MRHRIANDQAASASPATSAGPVGISTSARNISSDPSADAALLREAGIELRPAVEVDDTTGYEASNNAQRHREADAARPVAEEAQASAVTPGLAVPAGSGAPQESPGIHTAAGVAFFDGDHLLADDVKEMLQKPSDNVTTTHTGTTTEHWHQLPPVVHNTVYHHHYYVEEEAAPFEPEVVPVVVPVVVEQAPVVHNPPTALEKGKGREIADGRDVAEVAGLSAGAEAIHEYLENRDAIAAQAGIAPAQEDIPTRDFANLSVNDDPQQQQPTPRQALEAGLTTAAPLAAGESGSRFYEQLDGARRPGLTSHFSDATVQTAANNTAPPTPAIATKLDPFSTQRVETGTLHEVVPGPGRKIPLTELQHAKEIPVAAAGFAVPEGVRPQTQAQADFAHLSSPATSSPIAAVSPVDPEGAASAAKLESEYVPLAAGAGLAGIGAGSVAYGAASDDRQLGDNWSTRAIPPDSPAVTPGLANTPPRGQRNAGLRESVLTGALAPTADDPRASGVDTPSSTRAIKGSPPPQLVGQHTFLDESRVPQGARAEEEYAPVSPVQRSSTGHSRQSSIDRSVRRSPHLGVATRADSVGHSRLVKKHVKVPADELAKVRQHQQQHQQSPPSSPGAGSPAQVGSPVRTGSPVVAGAGATSSPMGRRRSGSAGADLWDHSVANVVNEETASRHGQRPQLVSIPSEDRRGEVLDRAVGVPDPTRQAPGSPSSPRQQQQQRFAQGAGSPRQQHVHVAPPVPGVAGIEQRGVVPGQAQVQGQQQQHGTGKLRRKSSVAREDKEKEKTGVFAKLFGHRKSGSQGGAGSEAGSPRASGEYARA